MDGLLRRFWSNLAGAKTAEAALRPPAEPPERLGAGAEITLQWSNGVGGWQSFPARIREVSGLGCSVASTTRPRRGAGVWLLRRQAPALKGSVRSTVRDGEQWRIEITLVPQEKRRLHRRPAEGRARVRWVDEQGRSRHADAEIQDLSDGGMQLALSAPAPVGYYIRIEADSLTCAGSTRYCRAEGDRYLVGVQFVDRPAPRAPDAALFQ